MEETDISPLRLAPPSRGSAGDRVSEKPDTAPCGVIYSAVVTIVIVIFIAIFCGVGLISGASATVAALITHQTHTTGAGSIRQRT